MGKKKQPGGCGERGRRRVACSERAARVSGRAIVPSCHRGILLYLPLRRCAWTHLLFCTLGKQCDADCEGCAEANGDGAEEAKPVE